VGGAWWWAHPQVLALVSLRQCGRIKTAGWNWFAWILITTIGIRGSLLPVRINGAAFGTTLVSPGGTRQGFDLRLDSNGLLEGLTWGNDFRTYQISQSAQNNGWTGWSVLSSDITVFKASLMVMSQNQNGRLEAFTHGSGNTIWHVAQTR
jgi:hypothetical protein